MSASTRRYDKRYEDRSLGREVSNPAPRFCIVWIVEQPHSPTEQISPRADVWFSRLDELGANVVDGDHGGFAARGRASSRRWTSASLLVIAVSPSDLSLPTRQNEAWRNRRASAWRMISQEEIDGYSHLSELPPGRIAICGLPEDTQSWTRRRFSRGRSKRSCPRAGPKPLPWR